MDLNSDAWLNLAFEGKNQQYGAYYLRKTSSGRHLVALVITLGITVVAVLLMLYIVFAEKTNDNLLKSVSISDLAGMESLHFEDPIKYKPTEMLPLEERVKPTPPKIVTEEEFTEVPETVFQTPDETQTTIPDVTTEVSSTDHPIPLQNTVEIDPSKDPITYVMDEKDPSREFQLLRTTILRYVYQHINYPETAYKQRIRGRVVCSFIVNENGLISDIALVSGTYIFLDEEVLRALHSMPACEPVKKDDKPVRVKCYLPVVFSL